MGFKNFNLEAQEDIAEAKRQKWNSDKGSRDGRGPNLSPDGYVAKSDDEENEELVNANDPVKKVADQYKLENIKNVEGFTQESQEPEDDAEGRAKMTMVKEPEEFVLDDNQGKMSSAHYILGDDGDTLLIARQGEEKIGSGPLEVVQEEIVDKLDKLPKSVSSGKVKANIFDVKVPAGHYRGGHFPSGAEKAAEREMRKARKQSRTSNQG